MHEYRKWSFVRSKFGVLPVDDGVLKEFNLIPFQWIDEAQTFQILLFNECAIETQKILDNVRDQVRRFKHSGLKNYRVWLRWQLQKSAARRIYGGGR